MKMIYKLILLVVLLNFSDCFAQDSTILQIYNFNENGDNFTGDIFNGDSLAKDALLIKTIIDFHKIVDFQSNFDKLIKESDFIGNYECFMPNIGLIIKRNGEVIRAITICFTCKKLFFKDYVSGGRGYLFFHNNSLLDDFFEENHLWNYGE